MPKDNIAQQIKVSDMAPHVHDFMPNENKVNKISKWLIAWIEKSLASGQIKPYYLLPTKGELAFHIGVSQGTMQNVFRQVEDYGLIESKQRIGTYIKDLKSSGKEKLTSKRELAAEEIKKFIQNNNYKIGDCLISTQKLSQITGISKATIRMSLGILISEGVLEKVNNVFIISKVDYEIKDVKLETLVDKTAKRIKNYIDTELKSGQRLPTNAELAKYFDVSVKTVHDAVKILAKEGALYPRRGQYGTIVTDSLNNGSRYSYEKIEQKIRHFIMEKCSIGDKLPSIVEFSNQFNVSAKTVKKALDNLLEEGFITFVRGRYGGTFVTDIPQGVNESYKWLALSSGYVSNAENMPNT